MTVVSGYGDGDDDGDGGMTQDGGAMNWGCE